MLSVPAVMVYKYSWTPLQQHIAVDCDMAHGLGLTCESQGQLKPVGVVLAWAACQTAQASLQQLLMQ